MSDLILDSDGDLDVTDYLGIRLFTPGQELAALRQRVQIALRSFRGDWFLDVTEGAPYMQQILGARGQGAKDAAAAALRDVVRSQPGVSSVESFTADLVNRKLTVSFVALTDFGTLAATIDVALD